MGNLLVVTGSLEGTTITGAWGGIYSLTDSQITITGSFGEARFVLPKGENFTDTGTWLTGNGITEVIAWSEANIILQSA